MVAAPLQLEAAGHDAAEASIDLGKKPTQRADLVAIGSALRGGRCARFLIAAMSASQARRMARSSRAGSVAREGSSTAPWKGRERVVDVADEIGATAFEPAQQPAQRTLDPSSRGDCPWPAVRAPLGVEPLDIAHQHPSVQVRERRDDSDSAAKRLKVNTEVQHDLMLRGDRAPRWLQNACASASRTSSGKHSDEKSTTVLRTTRGASKRAGCASCAGAATASCDRTRRMLWRGDFMAPRLRQQRVEHVLEDAWVDGNGAKVAVGGVEVLVAKQHLHDDQRVDLGASIGQVLEPGEQHAREGGPQQVRGGLEPAGQTAWLTAR